MTAIAHEGVSMRTPLAMSALLHVALAGVLLYSHSATHGPSAPVYRVNLVAAPPGQRQAGVVQPEPVVAPPTRQTPPPVARETPSAKKAPVKAKPVASPKVATPNTSSTAPVAKPTSQPIARGGPTGGKGADVANVHTDGIVFPYPAYLTNIVRQIAIQFKQGNRGALTAEVAFIIRRDGSVAGLRLTRRSSVYSFDQDALAAVELASKSFGPLPAEFADDALPVIFTFDPRIIR